MLKRDGRWEIFYGDISLEEFADKKIPKPVFKKGVNQEIKDAFEIVHKLLIHSYFEYLFLDVAVTKALHILEMTLCIRYKELTSKEWDLTKKPLFKLMDWFNENMRFEINNPKQLKYIRDIRNHMTHPKGHNFAGTVGLPWIHTVLDLINGLYEDTEARQKRWESTTEWGTKLESFMDQGGKLIYLNSTYYIYDMGPLKIENRLDPVLCYFSLLPLFNPKSTEPKLPLIFEYPLDALLIVGNRVELSLGTGMGYLTNKLNPEEIKKIAEFRALINSNEEYRIQSSMLIFHAQNSISEACGEKLRKLYQAS